MFLADELVSVHPNRFTQPHGSGRHESAGIHTTRGARTSKHRSPNATCSPRGSRTSRSACRPWDPSAPSALRSRPLVAHRRPAVPWDVPDDRARGGGRPAPVLHAPGLRRVGTGEGVLAVAGWMAAQGPGFSGWRITGCTMPSPTLKAIRIPPARSERAGGAGRDSGTATSAGCSPCTARLESTPPDWLGGSARDEDQRPYFAMVLLGLVLHGGRWPCHESVRGSSGVPLGGFARIFLLDHATWVVNSIGHTLGNRDTGHYGTRATTSGFWPRRPSAGPGTTTITPSPPRRQPPTLLAARSRRDFIRLLDCVGLSRRALPPGNTQEEKP